MNYGFEVFDTDIRRVADFYVTVLGFDVEGSAAPDADYLTVARNGLRVGCSHHPDAVRTPRKPPAGCEIVLRVHDIHREHDRVVRSGWPIEDPLQERPWGQTDFRVFDPTGLYIRVTDGARVD